MKQNRLALTFFLLVHAVIVFAGFVTPYSGVSQNREHPFAPPTKIRIVDAAGSLTAPFVYGMKLVEGSAELYEEDRSVALPLKFFVRGEEYKFLGLIPANLHLFGVAEPGRVFLLGTDRYGRDLFSRFAHGGELSLFAGLAATALTLVIAASLGGAAGFFGRAVDTPVMALSEIFLALPWLYLLLAVRAFLPLSLEPGAAILLLIVVIGVVGWAKPARLVRGVVLEIKERTFVEAARSFGATDWRTVRVHILPQTYTLLLTQATLLVPQYVLAEVTMSFFGLGIGPPAASWGTLLTDLQQVHVLESYWWMVLPACLMLPVFASYFVLASHLQSRLESPTS